MILRRNSSDRPSCRASDPSPEGTETARARPPLARQEWPAARLAYSEWLAAATANAGGNGRWRPWWATTREPVPSPFHGKPSERVGTVRSVPVPRRCLARKWHQLLGLRRPHHSDVIGHAPPGSGGE